MWRKYRKNAVNMKKKPEIFWWFGKKPYLCTRFRKDRGFWVSGSEVQAPETRGLDVMIAIFERFRIKQEK